VVKIRLVPPPAGSPAPLFFETHWFATQLRGKNPACPATGGIARSTYCTEINW